ncbi:hypothetical protein ACJX0J_002900, partial [Zea mays]
MSSIILHVQSITTNEYYIFRSKHLLLEDDEDMSGIPYGRHIIQINMNPGSYFLQQQEQELGMLKLPPAGNV